MKLSLALAHDHAKHTAIGQLLAERQECDRRRLAQDIDAFRATHQQVQHAREFDLVSKGNAVEYPIRFGPGSCLHFEC